MKWWNTITNSIACHEIHPPTLNAWGDCLQVLYHALIRWPPITQANLSKCFLLCAWELSPQEGGSKWIRATTYLPAPIHRFHPYGKSVCKDPSIYIYIYTLSWSLWIELFGLSFFSLCAFTFISWSFIWFCSSQWRAHPPRLFERLRQGDG